MSHNAPHRRGVEQYARFDRLTVFNTDWASRLGDLAIASMLLVLTLPLMLIIGLAIRYQSPGPVLVRQPRVGRDGRQFDMLRFRTTEYDADETVTGWAKKATRLGQFLRETRIGILPEFINVLRGDMSVLDRGVRSPSFLD
jgi:lipopolysaccharide/colanic/teichoic acid biosynthesis glycosyltransferase